MASQCLEATECRSIEGLDTHVLHAGRKLRFWDTWCGLEFCGVELASGDTLAAAGVGDGGAYSVVPQLSPLLNAYCQYCFRCSLDSTGQRAPRPKHFLSVLQRALD